MKDFQKEAQPDDDLQTTMTHLVVYVLLPPFWRDVCGKMIGELHACSLFNSSSNLFNNIRRWCLSLSNWFVYLFFFLFNLDFWSSIKMLWCYWWSVTRNHNVRWFKSIGLLSRTFRLCSYRLTPIGWKTQVPLLLIIVHFAQSHSLSNEGQCHDLELALSLSAKPAY